MRHAGALLLIGSIVLGWAAPASAVVLWSDLGATLAHETGPGTDILGGALKRDETSSDTLYFKFHVDPLSDTRTEEYFAAFQLYEGDLERLGVGNALMAWAYSAFNTTTNGEFNKVFGDMDLRSAQPESSSPGVFLPYELPRRGAERTIVFKVKYVPGGEDLITVWLNPDLSAGATEASQPEGLTTTFSANACFDQIRLRHGGGGGGWTFSDMEIATAFSDFVAAGGTDAGAGGGGTALTFRSWDREQGLPQNVVHALAQTRNGYLWIGSDDGVVRFDGVRFVSFGLREGLRSGVVLKLLEDSHGALWIGTASSGLTRWEKGVFTTFTKRDGLPADSITALGEDSEGRLWVGTEAGVAVLQNGRLSTPAGAEPLKGRAVTVVYKSPRGALWLGASGAGIFTLVEGKLVPLTDASVGSLLQNPHCLLEDKGGRVWIGAGDDFVLCRDGNQWLRYRIPRHLARPYVSELAEEADGTVWAGSVSEGLYRFKEGKLGAINASSGLLDNSAECLLIDREGNLWVGTSAGLQRLRHSSFRVFGHNEGLGYGPVQGMAEVAPGVIWAGKPGEGLYQWEGRKFSPVAAAGLPRRYPEVISLLGARDGSCWMSGVEGLWRVPGQKDTNEATVAGLAGLNVISLAEDKDGGLWAGTQEGQVWRLLQGNWMALTNYSQPQPITAILQDPEGAMWIGTGGGGLFRHQGEARSHFEKGSGLLSDYVRTLYMGSQGSVWIGTAGGGLSRWRDGRLATFTTREGLPDNTVSQILEDSAGRLWLGSNRGIACVSKQDLEELAAGGISMVYPLVYGRPEGMPSEECAGDVYPAGLKTSAGRLCFPTMKGVVVVDPRLDRADAPAPAVVLEETVVDGVVAEVSRAASAAGAANGAARDASAEPGEVRISPGQHRLEFRFTGMNLSAPERVRFRFRLEPLEAKWVESGARRTASYSYVPPGKYRFRVIACNSGGTWNEAGASVGLVVLPHFWQARWFLVLASVGLLGSVAGTVRLVERRKHQRRLKLLEQERTLEHERARIAQDLHDDLGSSLTRISLLSDLARADKDNPVQVETHAQKISQSAGQTVRALEEIVWALRPGSDSLQSLVEYIAHFANELFDGDAARCRLDLPHDLPDKSLPPEMRHNIFLVVKEALTNALKHGRAKEVRVQAKASAKSLEIVVQDDGLGFEVQALPPTPGKRHGLGNMHRRAENMGGTLTVESGNGKGTTVTLVVSFPA
jgi:signal transduction histidine kinase/ligand-binding sensor domain-containing protein